MDIEFAAQSLWSEMKKGRHLPSEWFGKLSTAEAYPVQLAVLRRFVSDGERQAGWKVGLTSDAMRAQQGIAEPCFGFLLQSGHRPSGAQFRIDKLISPGIENELCLTLGETLRGPGITYERARQAIAFVAPALEIAEVRGNFSADMPLSIADNVQQKAFVTGAPLPLTDQSLAGADVRVSINGVERAVATGAEVMGDPVNSLLWLANRLADYGVALEAGMRVMSGSFTKQYAVQQGDTVQSRFNPFGFVEASFN
jgi:2-keto-4-pentenoate hydratase